MTTEPKVINLAEELFKRRGVKIDVDEVARAHAELSKREHVNPEDDLVVAMAMDIVKAVNERTDSNPVAVVAALLLVGDTLQAEYVRRMGFQGAARLVAIARQVSTRYQAEFKHGTDDNESLDRDQPDEPKR